MDKIEIGKIIIEEAIKNHGISFLGLIMSRDIANEEMDEIMALGVNGYLHDEIHNSLVELGKRLMRDPAYTDLLKKMKESMGARVCNVQPMNVILGEEMAKVGVQLMKGEIK